MSDSGFLPLALTAYRVRLLPLTEIFSDDILREFNPQITRYMLPAPLANRDEAMNFIERCRRGWQSGEFLMFAICAIQNDEFLGGCSLQSVNQPTPELGVWLKKSAHGNGYGREAVTALVKWSQQNIRCDYLLYPVDRRNIASRKIPESLGGQIISQRKRYNRSGFELDEVVYRIGVEP